MKNFNFFLANYGLVLFPFSLALPLPLIYSSITLALFVVVLILNIEWKSLKINSFIVIISMLFFLIDPLSFLFTFNPDRIQINETKIAYFFIPFLVYNSQKIIFSNLKRILYAFVLGTLIYVLYAWIFVFYFFNFMYPEWRQFSLTDGYLIYVLYNYLPGSIHHTYIGLYLLFSISILLCYPLKTKFFKISTVIIIFLSFCLIYIGGKLTIVILLINYLIYFLFKKNIKYKYSLPAIVFSLALGLWKGKEILYFLGNSYGERINYYQCGFLVLKDNFLQGVGFRNIKNSINYCQKINFESSVLIPHNSILYEILANGILGFILICSLYIYLIKKFILTKNVLLRNLITSVLLIGLIEDVFYRQRGVFFIAIFFSTILICESRILKTNRKAQ